MTGLEKRAWAEYAKEILGSELPCSTSSEVEKIKQACRKEKTRLATEQRKSRKVAKKETQHNSCSTPRPEDAIIHGGSFSPEQVVTPSSHKKTCERKPKPKRRLKYFAPQGHGEHVLRGFGLYYWKPVNNLASKMISKNFERG